MRFPSWARHLVVEAKLRRERGERAQRLRWAGLPTGNDDGLALGLTKCLIFAGLITIVSVINGISVKGGAEGVGRVTTSAVVHGILAIVLTDMIFVFMTTS